jgi:predicted transcriptional regulator
MTSKKLTKIDKSVLLGLCQTPWANDREIAEAEKIKMSTVTASKNRLKRDGTYKKAYLPAFQRLGYPLVSISQLCIERPQDAVLKALSKYQDLTISEDNKTLVSYMVCDQLNNLVMAHHRDYTAFKEFERVFGPDAKWSHQVLTMDKATKVVNFNYTNIINKQFFPQDHEIFKPKAVDNTSFHFHKRDKKVFNGLLAHQGTVMSALAQKTTVTRQSIMKMVRRFRSEGILDRITVLDLGRLGIQIMSVLQFKTKGNPTNEVAKITRMLVPFYYWVFDDVHVLMVGNTDYKELVSGLGQLNKIPGISELKWQSFDVGTADDLSLS